MTHEELMTAIADLAAHHHRGRFVTNAWHRDLVALYEKAGYRWYQVGTTQCFNVVRKVGYKGMREREVGTVECVRTAAGSATYQAKTGHGNSYVQGLSLNEGLIQLIRVDLNEIVEREAAYMEGRG